jgi:hypothetical protein
VLARGIPLVVAGALLLTSLAGCLETAPATITIQNDSDQTIVLQNISDSGAKTLGSTILPRTTQTSSGSPAKGLCYDRWEIVDAAGRVLRTVDKVCEGDTIKYP